MAAWLPLIKVILYYVAPIVQAAIPAFTKKKNDKADPLVALQISELQEAVKTNSEFTKSLAKAIEEAAQAYGNEMRRARLIAVVAIAMAVLSLTFAVASLLK
ncbi:MAG TPA: hypothetical protein DDW31_09125 [candidate division Zixibacteria bacterium]|nr:hypothetical protein [candidate division Zixibacteria bacterium]